MVDLTLNNRPGNLEVPIISPTEGGESMPSSTLTLPDLNFSDLEIVSVREAVAVPETGATSGSSSCKSCSCCGSSSCCSSS
jgi:thiazolylpeptide-type bacteriocin precursor